jgi:hypothetical protein
MKGTLSKIYAIALTIGFIAAEILLLCLPAFSQSKAAVSLLIGLALSLFLAPTFHELGHVFFAEIAKTKWMYVKLFCFSFTARKKGFSVKLANPFSADQTQVIPKSGENMKKRAIKYTLGGLIFGFGYLFLLLVAAFIVMSFGVISAMLWGMIPYAAYLFLLNVVPAEYASGKTDMQVFVGILKEDAAEQAMLAAMEIHGKLFEGYSYAEINEELFAFNALREDEPIWAVVRELCYRKALEEGDFVRAAKELERFAQAEGYLTESEYEMLAAEYVYMHALNGDFEKANKCAEACKNFLSGETPAAKRILATCSYLRGEELACKALIEQAKLAFAEELIEGNKKFEEMLLSRLEGVEEKK